MISILSFLLMVVGLLGLLAIRSLFWPAPLVIALQVAAALLMVWARVTFGVRSFHAEATPTEGGLVTAGPYRFIRHPIYTAAVLFCFAGAFAHPTPTSTLLAGAVLAGALVRMFSEEKLLKVRYPEYQDYAARTKRMVPFLF